MSSQRPSDQGSNMEESKSTGMVDEDILGGGQAQGSGGWDNQYLNDIFGAIDDIDDDDEVALEHLGEQEYQRQISL